MVDANQVWDIEQAIEWMKQLAEFKPLWIEEPTSPDDILGHATISKVNLQNMWTEQTQDKTVNVVLHNVIYKFPKFFFAVYYAYLWCVYLWP
jgi:hypothetical protein